MFGQFYILQPIQFEDGQFSHFVGIGGSPSEDITMIAGDYLDIIFGYAPSSNPFSIPAFGSISAEPLEGQTMLTLYYSDPATYIVFSGDVVTLLSTKTLYVNDTPYPLSGASYNADGDFTSVSWGDNNGPVFVEGISYDIRIE